MSRQELGFDFIRTINTSEVQSTYLNLTDDEGQAYGTKLGLAHKEPLIVIDGSHRKIRAYKHHKNQLWGTIKKWFEANAIRSGNIVRFSFDPQERADGLPVLHLEVKRAPDIEADTQARAAEGTADVPLGLEKQIEDFLAHNLERLEPGLELYTEDERQGRQYPTSVGVIDLLCQRPNGDFVVVELKRGRASDKVVGQISRYIGWVQENIANGQDVYGLILAADGDEAMRYAVAANPKLRARYMVVRLELTDEPPE